MAFEDNKSAFSQQHFTIIEIDIPVVNGTCTLNGGLGFGTALTCDEAINGTKTYKFTMDSAPILPISDVFRCIKSINETPTELQSGRGLASRGSLSITFNDFKGDPNPEAPAVTDEVKAQGTFFGKMDARNILQNRDIRIKNYRIVNGEFPDLDNDAQVRHYIIEGFGSNGDGTWKLSAKDELSRVNLDEKVWPPVLNDFLTGDIPASTEIIPVTDSSIYSVNRVIRIGDELMTVISIPSATTLTVRSRGSVVGVPQFTNNLSRTEAPSEKSAGDEIYLCRPYDGANIADVLYDILTDVGVDPSFIPLADWYAEIAEWHASTEVITLFTESEDVNDVLGQMLESYMLDMWFDPVDREIKLSAISVWKDSAISISEGVEIDYGTLKRTTQDGLRATDATIVYDKPFKAAANDTENFRKASYYQNPVLVTEKYYGEAKQKMFDNNPIINRDAGDLLVQRYVSRYGISPQMYKWTTQERFLNFNTGDVVDISADDKQGFDGLTSSTNRAQVISIKPNYNGYGRDYKVSALTYEPAFSDGAEIVIAGNVGNINLYNQYAGAPADAVTLTFIFDGTTVFSSSPNSPAITLGNFAAGSKVIIILANGADLQGAGGKGGAGGGAFYDREFGTWIPIVPTVGGAGGTVLDCNGVDCDIYFSGSTPSASYATADGYIRAPGGGGGANNASIPTETGASGGGGAGRNGGKGGETNQPLNELPSGTRGNDGTPTGTGGSSPAGNGGAWGQPGSPGVTTGGDAGKGIVDSGATVVLYGSDAVRYINGNGDH